MANKSNWKGVERAVAKILKCDRVPVADKRSTTDVINEWLAVEVKATSSPPKFVQNALGQAERAADDKQLPIAVIHPKGGNHAQDLVVMRLGDFVEHFVS